MRFLVKVTPSVTRFNECVREGTANARVQQILDEIKPEAVYFYETGGRRTVLMVVEMEKTSQMPAIAEPWFLYFDAEVDFEPCMLPEDLAEAGLEELGRKYG